jgi:hypothetical protein
VKGARGGKIVEDQFEVASVDIVHDLVGVFNKKRAHCHGALVFRDNNTAVMLVPPLEFKFRTKRQGDGDARTWPTEMSVTGHFMCLVDRKGPSGPRWAFDSTRAEYSSSNKHAYKIAVAAAMHELGPNIVPNRLLNFLSLLL